MDAPIRPPLSRTAPLYDYHSNFPGGGTFTAKILSFLDPKALVQFSRTCKDFHSFVYAAQEIWKSHYPLSDYCYPPIEPDWRKAYSFLHNRITKKPEGNFFSGLPLDVKKIVFTFMDGRSLARLSGVSRHLYHLIDREMVWKQAFIQDNNGYTPEITTWKKDYYNQGLQKRNIKCGNFRFHEHTGEDYLLYDRIRYQADGRFIRCINDDGKIIKSLQCWQEPINLLDLGRGRYLSFQGSSPMLNQSVEILPDQSNSATLWEKDKKLLDLVEQGVYKVSKNFVIRKTDDSVYIYCLLSKSWMQTFPKKDWIDLQGDQYITSSNGNLCIYDIRSNRLLRSFSVIIEPYMYLGTILDSQNDNYKIMVFNTYILILNNANDSFDLCQMSNNYGNLALKDHFFYRVDDFNQNQMHLIDLKDQKTTKAFAIPETIHKFRIFGNRIIVSSHTSHYVFDRLKENLLFTVSHNCLQSMYFIVHSHIIYKYRSDGWEFFNIGNQTLIGKLTMPHQYKSKMGDGNYLNGKLLINWTNPLPPLPQPTLMQRVSMIWTSWTNWTRIRTFWDTRSN